MSGILSGLEIINAVSSELITVDPFVPEHVNPASLDLCLGDMCRIYTKDLLDAKEDNPTALFKIPDDGIILHPGQLYLMHTVERISTTNYVPVLDGKSSIGRLGIQIHLTAGYGDPGFNGQYTMEVISAKAVRVYAGMRFCQMRFHTIEGSIVNYDTAGNYKGENATGPVASRSWRQFERGLLYECHWCKKSAPKADWGPGRVTCPNCKKIQPSVSQIQEMGS